MISLDLLSQRNSKSPATLSDWPNEPALLPIVPLYLIRQNLFRDRHKPGYIKYRFREALHAARDRFTPRYVHRHTEEEVCAWFSEAGYSQLRCISKRKPPQFVPAAFRLGTGIDGTRNRA